MSRIGKNPVLVPQGVTVDISGQDIKVKGKLGELSMRAHDEVSVALQDGKVVVSPRSESRLSRSLWATTRNLVRNMVQGVSAGYTQKLEIQGVGYRAALQGKDLVLQLGYSHEVRYAIPAGITITVDKQTALSISGIDKQQVGQVSAEIISWRPPEPYKGKGIRYEGQKILRKEGKKK